MYGAQQHRGMPPVPPGGSGANNRLAELLEQVRQEFEAQLRQAGDYEHQIAQQIQEVDLVRQKVYQLEQTQLGIKQKYEDEVNRLRHELEARGGLSASHMGGPSHHVAPSQPQPPSIGHGPSNLFGGIMAGGAQGGGPGLAPPPQDGPKPPNLQHGVPPGPPGLNSAPGPPSHAPFGSYNSMNGGGYGGPQPPPPGSPGGKPRINRGPPGAQTPQQTQIGPYPGSPQVPRPTPPPGGQAHHPPGIHPPIPNVGNTLADLDPEQIPASHKREGQDWFAIFNPAIRRQLDVDLVHNLPHNSVVCCVRFSNDGRLVATGCNRSAQIFDVDTGTQVAHLQDPALPQDGDLYIRSVCFSPDGRSLATGAEDKIIRVWDIATRTIRHQFQGHEQDIYSLDFARNGKIIASGSGDRSVRLWDLENNSQALQLSIEDGVTTVALSPDSRYVAAGSLDKSVRVWDTATGFLVERLEGEPGHKDSVYSVAFSPSGRELVSGSLDKTIKMWELAPARGIPGQGPAGGTCVRTFEGHKVCYGNSHFSLRANIVTIKGGFVAGADARLQDFVLSVALTPGGEWVLSGSKDRGVQFWDPKTGEAQLMLQGHKNSVISVAPGPSRNLFATGSGDMRARIWRYIPAGHYQ
ncbi:MAG: general transcription repressor [Bathelium mastoideum]|nr:MAG: general transcription repressor [Bathelium mastoideum]KAI9687558.1 MAG: general transcription repressor [Bathelium mastoideum]